MLWFLCGRHRPWRAARTRCGRMAGCGGDPCAHTGGSRWVGIVTRSAFCGNRCNGWGAPRRSAPATDNAYNGLPRPCRGDAGRSGTGQSRCTRYRQLQAPAGRRHDKQRWRRQSW